MMDEESFFNVAIMADDKRIWMTRLEFAIPLPMPAHILEVDMTQLSGLFHPVSALV